MQECSAVQCSGVVRQLGGMVFPDMTGDLLPLARGYFSFLGFVGLDY